MAEIDLATASQLFDTEVTLKFQNSQRLAGTIEERHGTRGEAVNVPVSDIIEMTGRTFAAADIPVTPINLTNQVIVPLNYAVKTVIGGGERTLFAYNMITDHARDHAKAAGRMVDYIKIRAIFDDADFADIEQIAKTVGLKTGLNAAKMTEGLAYLEGQGVDVYDHNISMWTPAPCKAQLLEDEKVVSFFYNDRRPLVNGHIDSYLGVDIRTLGSNGINQIPFTTASGTDTYQVPMVAHDSMVQIFNRDPMTSITWVPQEDRYELVTVLTSGAKVIQTNGIVLLVCDVPQVANP